MIVPLWVWLALLAVVGGIGLGCWVAVEGG